MSEEHTGSAAGTSTEPIDGRLADLTLAAVRAASRAADDYLAGDGWRPRVALPDITSFDSGWPNLRSRSTFPPEDAPTKYSGLFSQEPHPYRPLLLSHLDEFEALLSYIRSSDVLSARLAPPATSALADRMLEFEAVDLPLSILDRAHATDSLTDEGLLALFVQRERAWLLDPLPVEYVVPLLLTDLGVDNLKIDFNTRIERMSDADQAARTPEASPIGNVPTPLLGAATHAVVLSGLTLANPGPTRRAFGPMQEDLPLREADLACEALRVATSAHTGYAQILRRPLGWSDGWKHDLPPLSEVSTIRRYPDVFDNYGWLGSRSPVPVDDLELLPSIVHALRVAPPTVRLASRRLSLAALREAAEDRIVDACIGLEALLGEGRDELSHRLALRAATALSTRPSNPMDAHKIYELTKKAYNHRSAIVHGGDGVKSRKLVVGADAYDAPNTAVELLRLLLSDVLSRPEKWTPQSLDATLLSALTGLNQNE